MAASTRAIAYFFSTAVAIVEGFGLLESIWSCGQNVVAYVGGSLCKSFSHRIFFYFRFV
jgi:3-deoxy-D-manno-octulosonic-acid transferase